MIGIYGIRNNTNNKLYIGLSSNILDRISRHKVALKNNKHKNKHLQSAYNKCDSNNFEYIIIEECIESDLSIKEKHYIALYESWNSKYGYNKTHGGEFGRLVDEIIISNANKLRGRTLTDEMKKRISNTLKGRKQDSEAILKRSKNIRKIDEKKELLICDMLINKQLTKIKIAEILNIKITSVVSVLHRINFPLLKENNIISSELIKEIKQCYFNKDNIIKQHNIPLIVIRAILNDAL